MQPATQPDPLRWKALILLAAAQFMVVLDASIVNVALPSIKDALDFSQQNLQWIVNGYTLAFGGFLLLGGRAADLLGRRKVFMAGLLLFGAASLAGGLAQSEGWLIAARFVQGLGAAILSPAALSIVTTTFTEGKERNTALGIWGALAGAGGAAGVLLGGMLTQWLGWEWVLFVNVPIVLAVVAFVPRFVRESSSSEQSGVDIAGAVSVTAGLVALVYALVDANSAGWGSTQTDRAARAVGGPDRRVRRDRAALEGADHAAGDLPQPQRGQRRRGRPADRRVAVLDVLLHLALPAAGAGQVGARQPASATCRWPSRSSSRPARPRSSSSAWGPSRCSPPGWCFIAVGLLLFTRVSADGSLRRRRAAAVDHRRDRPRPLVRVDHDHRGGGGRPPTRRASASGLINTAQQVGGALGLAILSTVASSRTSHVLGRRAARTGRGPGTR